MVVKKPPSSAGDAGLIPSQGAEIPHPLGQLEGHTHHHKESDAAK